MLSESLNKTFPSFLPNRSNRFVNFVLAPSIELVGGSTNRGRVELLVDGRRGTVCATARKDTTAKVACIQKGYNDGVFTRLGVLVAQQRFSFQPVLHDWCNKGLNCIILKTK